MFTAKLAAISLLVIGPAVAYQGIVLSDGLTHWTDNLNIDVARSTLVREEEPLHIVFELLEWHSPFTFCRIQFGEYKFLVTEDAVIDQNGNVPQDIHPWSGNDDKTICGISVDSYNSSFLGDYSQTVRVDFYMEDQLAYKVSGYVSMEDEVTQDLRLTELVTPINYKLALSPQYDSDFLPDGTPSIDFLGTLLLDFSVSSEPQECVTVHADEMQIISASIDGKNVVDLRFDFQRTLLSLCPQEANLALGYHSTVIDYRVKTVREGRYNYGLYYQPCREGSGKTCWYTQGQSTNARNIFPSFDEPAFKAPIDVSVQQRDGYTILSNMPLRDIDALGYWNFEKSEAMSSYLFALSITDYLALQTDIRENVTLWCPWADMIQGRATYGVEAGARVLNFYEEYFDVKYTLPKMDLVAEEKKFTAMENWGLALFDPEMLLLDPELAAQNSTNEERWLVSRLIAHELAHQWFGNLVTLNWWSQLWINEGFAVYVSFLGTNLVDPANKPQARMVVEQTKFVMKLDSDAISHWALTDSVTSRSDIHRKFGDITYCKGGSIIRMMEGILTEPALQQGLRSYLKENSYSSTTEDDLFVSLSESATQMGTWPGSYSGSLDLSEVLKSWTDQAGYPIIHATVECPSGNDCKLHASQSMYVTNGTDFTNRKWTVPLFLNVPGDDQPRILWHEQQSSETVTYDISNVYDENSISLLNLNHESYGYYRVMYDQEHWLRISNARVMYDQEHWLRISNARVS